MIAPLSLCVYENRTSFTTITPMVPLLPTLKRVDRLRWSKGVYGWFLEMEFHCSGLREAEALFWLDQAMGRLARLEVFGNYIWEGMVYEVSAELPGATLTRSMEPLANKVYCEYSDNDTGSNAVTSAKNDTTSQAKYGVKEVYLAGGTRNSTEAGNYAARYLESHADPPVVQEITDRPPGLAGLTVLCRGYFETLKWQFYTSTTTGNQDSALTIGDIATSEGAFLSATQSLEATGRTEAKRRFSVRQTAWEQMMTMVALGTSNDLRYFLGVKKDRVLTGWEEPITLSYIKRPDRPGTYYNTAGLPLHYFELEPGRWIRAQLPLGDSATPALTDPSYLIIGSCEYDGITRKVVPHYGITPPPIPSAKGDTEQDWKWPAWSYYEFNIQGYQAAFVNGKWIYRYAGWYGDRNEQKGGPGWQAREDEEKGSGGKVIY